MVEIEANSCVFFAVLAVGIAMILPNVEFILGLNGAINGVLLSYIMPSLIYLKISNSSLDLQPKKSGEGIKSKCCIFNPTPHKSWFRRKVAQALNARQCSLATVLAATHFSKGERHAELLDF